jgi:serine protease AprX
MAPSSRPPEEHTRVKPFDPLVLDRTVIALPLLKAMREDFEHIRVILEAHPEAEREYNTAIEYNAGFPGGPEAARRLVDDMATRAAQKALEVSKRQLSTATEETRERLEKRQQALEEAVRSQKIAPLMPEGSYGFAILHASVIRRILNENDRLASADPRTSMSATRGRRCIGKRTFPIASTCSRGSKRAQSRSSWSSTSLTRRPRQKSAATRRRMHR